MSEDILYRIRAINEDGNLQFTPETFNNDLVMIEFMCLFIPLINLGCLNLIDR